MNTTVAEIVTEVSGDPKIVVIDGSSNKEADADDIFADVSDELCSDESFKMKNAECHATKIKETRELLKAAEKGEKIGKSPGEIILEVRPQYCTFSEHDLADKLISMGLELVCLPWVANTGRQFYTAGFKTRNEFLEFDPQRSLNN
eukprot:GFUD01067416.1.p2 GENE.GFUD01067416.1~~GFUD01067416.1.p2  ORF type:complete len:146 (+),score=26.37 GFUD01067416.1:303-740(+)